MTYTQIDISVFHTHVHVARAYLLVFRKKEVSTLTIYTIIKGKMNELLCGTPKNKEFKAAMESFFWFQI